MLRCIAEVGTAGCGFEHQLAAVARALGADGRSPPPENQGFIRAEALLAIVLLTNEDDCSAPVNSLLYDTAENTNLGSTVGPPRNFRCNEFGHLCGAPPRKPPRLSPDPGDLTTEVALDGCVSAEDQGMLTPVATFVQQLRALKSDPASQLQVVSLQGAATPYRIHWQPAPTEDTGPWPAIEPSCDAGEVGRHADPGVRLQQFVQQLGDTNAATSSICETNFAPPLEALATKLAAILAPRPRG